MAESKGTTYDSYQAFDARIWPPKRGAADFANTRLVEERSKGFLCTGLQALTGEFRATRPTVQFET